MQNQMLRSLFLNIWALLGIIFLISCSPSSDNNKNNNTTTLTAFQKEVQGTWLSECAYDDELHYTETYIFEKTVISLITHFYSDNKCTNIAGTEKYTGSFDITSAEQKDIRNIDILVDNVTLTANSDAFVQQFNGKSYCGYADWTINKAKDVTGKNCDSETYFIKGTRLYGILRFSGDSSKSKFFASDLDESLDHRPKTTSVYSYTKQ